ncbi:MAG: hypothetical protein IT372_36655 [Polyangiaceae bacterium]|nr:hypothetical protein [Polyangiaceae bacterium]
MVRVSRVWVGVVGMLVAVGALEACYESESGTDSGEEEAVNDMNVIIVPEPEPEPVSTCDNNPDGCGWVGAGCIGCAVQGECATEMAACAAAGSGCSDFADCMAACAPEDSACADACSATFPAGAAAYIALATCTICEVCPNDCEASTAGCPGG